MWNPRLCNIQIVFFIFRILSALAHWAPIFGETQFLPSLAFPFVKLFQNNHLVCFEMIATVLGKFGFFFKKHFCVVLCQILPAVTIYCVGMRDNADTLMRSGFKSKLFLKPFFNCSINAQNSVNCSPENI